jgi:hypothetical protein
VSWLFDVAVYVLIAVAFFRLGAANEIRKRAHVRRFAKAMQVAADVARGYGTSVDDAAAAIARALEPPSAKLDELLALVERRRRAL